jgi:hypothetical protein
MPALLTARDGHACCVVRDTLVVIGGLTTGADAAVVSLSSVEILSEDGGVFVSLPQLSCGGIDSAAAIAVEESESVAGQVLLFGGEQHTAEDQKVEEWTPPLTTVYLLDLATGVCTPQEPQLPGARSSFAAARLKDGRIFCAGGTGADFGKQLSVAVYEPPGQGAPDAT